MTWFILWALWEYFATVAYVVLQRTPGVVWLPGKLISKPAIEFDSKNEGNCRKNYWNNWSGVIWTREEFEDPEKMFIDTIEEEEAEPKRNTEVMNYWKKNLLKRQSLRRRRLLRLRNLKLWLKRRRKPRFKYRRTGTNKAIGWRRSKPRWWKKLLFLKEFCHTPKPEETDALK